MRRRRLGPALVVLLVAIALSCGSVRDDELSCEEAVARLQDCCPGIDPRRLNCEFETSCSSSNVPVVTERAAECIRARACADLEARGICGGLERLSKEAYPSSRRAEIEAEACK